MCKGVCLSTGVCVHKRASALACECTCVCTHCECAQVCGCTCVCTCCTCSKPCAKKNRDVYRLKCLWIYSTYFVLNCRRQPLAAPAVELFTLVPFRAFLNLIFANCLVLYLANHYCFKVTFVALVKTLVGSD